MTFNHKVILITGAASGIGQLAARTFAQQKARVVVADLNQKQGQETVDQINAAGGTSFFTKVDVARAEEVAKLVDTTVAQFGQLDIAINNAGITGAPARTADKSLEDWERIMSVNANGVFYGMKYQLQQMMQQGHGIILNTASVAGLRGMPNNVAYTASKHAVVGMTKAAAMEYARKNIRINAICPVFTLTPMFDPQQVDQVMEGLSGKLKAQIPMGRFANPSEIVSAMLWLCSEEASFVTGLAMPVDGGMG